MEVGLEIARTYTKRVDCRRAKHCAVLFDAQNRILCAGYNGAPSGSPLSCEAGDCPRGMKTADQQVHNAGDYSDCIALHAEQNCIGDAARRGVKVEGSWMAITGHPCPMCLKTVRAAGVAKIYYPYRDQIRVIDLRTLQESVWFEDWDDEEAEGC